MNRTGADLEISLSRLYHLEMASSASNEAPRRPSDTPKCFCGPNLAQGWHRIRFQQNAPIAATPAAPSPPAQSSLRPVAAPSYLPGRLPKAPRRRAMRFVSATPTLKVFPSPSISSPRRRLGPSPLDRGPGVGRSDRTYLGFLGGAPRAAQGRGHCAGKPV